MPEQLTDDEFLALFRRPPSVGRQMSSVDSVEYLTLVTYLVEPPVPPTTNSLSRSSVSQIIESEKFGG
jgi:hypothetical protein